MNLPINAIKSSLGTSMKYMRSAGISSVVAGAGIGAGAAYMDGDSVVAGGILGAAAGTAYGSGLLGKKGLGRGLVDGGFDTGKAWAGAKGRAMSRWSALGNLGK